MERIKQALEKAREQREKAASTESQNASAPEQSVETTQSEPPASPAPDTATAKTRTISLDQKLVTSNRVILNPASKDPIASAYNLLRTQVLQQMQANNWNTLAITSAGQNEGKSVTSINLALSLSRELSSTVLLVDADMKQPDVHNYFGMQNPQGLSDFLTGNIPLSDLLVRPEQIERFVFLPGGTPINNSAEMLNSPKMRTLVEEIRTRYPDRFVIFDLPPVLSASDALAFSPYVDASLIVVEEGKTQEEDLVRTIELMQKENLLGTVLNKAHLSDKELNKSTY